MERLRERGAVGLNSGAIRAIGMLMLTIGVIGRGLLQSHLLNLGAVSIEELLTTMEADYNTMMLVAISLVCQAVETCAAPLFAFLLVEGFQHTSDLKQYFIRLAALAVVCEIPYNLAMTGKILNVDSRNPVFALVIGLAMLYLLRMYEEKVERNKLLKALAIAAALIWPMLLRIEDGICLVFLIWILWKFRSKPTYRNLAGAGAAMVCSLVSVFYVASPISMLTVHFYNGERGSSNRALNYLAYPVILLLVAALRLVF